MSKVEEEKCSLCASPHEVTFHHLIPRTCHSNKWFKKNFSRDEMTNSGIDVCRKCHSFIHKKFSEKVLGRNLNTLDKIKNNEEIGKYVEWARKRW